MALVSGDNTGRITSIITLSAALFPQKTLILRWKSYIWQARVIVILVPACTVFKSDSRKLKYSEIDRVNCIIDAFHDLNNSSWVRSKKWIIC